MLSQIAIASVTKSEGITVGPVWTCWAIILLWSLHSGSLVYMSRQCQRIYSFAKLVYSVRLKDSHMSTLCLIVFYPTIYLSRENTVSCSVI